MKTCWLFNIYRYGRQSIYRWFMIMMMMMMMICLIKWWVSMANQLNLPDIWLWQHLFRWTAFFAQLLSQRTCTIFANVSYYEFGFVRYNCITAIIIQSYFISICPYNGPNYIININHINLFYTFLLMITYGYGSIAINTMFSGMNIHKIP